MKRATRAQQLQSSAESMMVLTEQFFFNDFLNFLLDVRSVRILDMIAYLTFALLFYLEHTQFGIRFQLFFHGQTTVIASRPIPQSSIGILPRV